jgi:hypothetical protein
MKNNTEMTLDQVLAFIKRKIAEFDTQGAAAQAWGVSDSYLSEVLKGKQKPGPKILDALNLEHVDKYRWRKKD